MNNTLAWYALQIATNQELKVKTYLEKFRPLKELTEDIGEILMPVETVAEVKDGKKTERTRKLYPGYLFIQARLYDADGQLLVKPWYFIKEAKGVLSFIGRNDPTPLKDKEIELIKAQISAADGKEVPKVQYSVGEAILITDGPFSNLQGQIEELDPARGKLKVSVSIFGRFTPVELEYWQIKRYEEKKS
jgi:transcriptional antiterminator NusG